MALCSYRRRGKQLVVELNYCSVTHVSEDDLNIIVLSLAHEGGIGVGDLSNAVLMSRLSRYVCRYGDVAWTVSAMISS